MTNDIDRIAGKYLAKGNNPASSNKQKPSMGWRDRFSAGMRKTALIATGVGTLALAGFAWLEYDALTKRQDYPIRNVLYQAKEEIKFMGAERGKGIDEVAMTSESIIQGGDVLTKLGNTIGRVKYHYTSEYMQYQLENAEQSRIAFASEKHERVQAGGDVRGTINFLERQAELIDKPGKFATYSFIPERGCTDVELNLIFDNDNKPQLVNELVTHRDCNPLHLALGFFDGAKHRSGAELNTFPRTSNNVGLEHELLNIVERYNTHQLDIADREAMINRILAIHKELEKQHVIVSDEDGIFDWLPQESTTYLFGPSSRSARPGVSTGKMGVYPAEGSWSTPPEFRIENPTGDAVRLRVENHFNLFPGRIIGLKNLSFGSGKNLWEPFNKYNNGGYEIRDGTGTVAEVRFRDFWRRYGKDVVYEYYLDKNGDGRIQDDEESIGRVLFHVDNDEDLDVGTSLGPKEGKKDVTYNVVYSFMRGSDPTTAHQDFYLCNAFESFLLNEANRGYGKHSYLGYVNTQRSNILLLETRTVPNLGRALTIESAIVAEPDMVNLLRAAGRDYVDRYVTPIAKAVPNPKASVDSSIPPNQ